MAPETVPIAAQIAAVEREIKMRERVYPRWIASGTMKAGKAESELAAMRAVLATLQALPPEPPAQEALL